MAEQRYCSKCNKTMADTNFYQYKNGDKCELCKSCLTMHINTYDEETYKWMIQKFDAPYVPAEWKKTREKEFEKAYNKAQNAGSKDPKNAAYSMTKGNGVVFGKYLSKMKIKPWLNYSWADSEKLAREQEEKAKLYGISEEEMQQKIDSIKEAYANGEISEAQYMTYVNVNPSVEDERSLEQRFMSGDAWNEGGVSASPYPTNDNPFVKVDLPDVGGDLTEEDKIYLALKWGRLYTAEDWVTLEKTYSDYEKSFDIHNADLQKGLIQLCKLDLKLNQAMDSGDFDSYSKLYRSYDALRKSLKFTEAQNKDGTEEEFDSVGSIVAFCETEKGGGYIPEYKITAPLDIIDTIIEDNKEYLRTLWNNDAGLRQLIEQFLKKQEILAEQKADKKKAKEQGLEDVEISDKDYADFYAAVQSDAELDKNNIFAEEVDE